MKEEFGVLPLYPSVNFKLMRTMIHWQMSVLSGWWGLWLASFYRGRCRVWFEWIFSVDEWTVLSSSLWYEYITVKTARRINMSILLSVSFDRFFLCVLSLFKLIKLRRKIIQMVLSHIQWFQISSIQFYL